MSVRSAAPRSVGDLADSGYLRLRAQGTRPAAAAAHVDASYSGPPSASAPPVKLDLDERIDNDRGAARASFDGGDMVDGELRHAVVFADYAQFYVEDVEAHDA